MESNWLLLTIILILQDIQWELPSHSKLSLSFVVFLDRLLRCWWHHWLYSSRQTRHIWSFYVSLPLKDCLPGGYSFLFSFPLTLHCSFLLPPYCPLLFSFLPPPSLSLFTFHPFLSLSQGAVSVMIIVTDSVLPLQVGDESNQNQPINFIYLRSIYFSFTSMSPHHILQTLVVVCSHDLVAHRSCALLPDGETLLL